MRCAATLYHLLTGQEPPPATDRISATPDPLPAPKAVNRNLSAAVADAVAAAMAMSVTQRPFVNHPVTDVDWGEACNFAVWLGGRLPT